MKIDLTSKTMYNCHAAVPHKIDFDWLEKNPGNLFNNPISVFEREQMLRNERNTSCEQNCWPAEDNNAVSPRMYQNGVEKTHTDIITSPETIDLTIGTNCNLTCSYCCKEYSSSWIRDILKKGNYKLTNYKSGRYQANTKDKLLLKLSPSEVKNSKHYQLLFKEIELVSPTLKYLTVSGGEPLLDNQLLSLLEKLNLKSNIVIKLFTGLGLSHSRFKNILGKLKNIKNLDLRISAENIDSYLEFNRYGIKWEEFKKKIELIQESKINFEFHCVISNLTIFGFEKFYDYYKNNRISVTFAYQPTMMAPYVLDDHSKTLLNNSLKILPKKIHQPIVASIQKQPSELQRLNCKEFLLEFASRRNINLNIFPKSFLEWLQLENML
jgi:organic radical activating enzyme